LYKIDAIRWFNRGKRPKKISGNKRSNNQRPQGLLIVYGGQEWGYQQKQITRNDNEKNAEIKNIRNDQNMGEKFQSYFAKTKYISTKSVPNKKNIV